jgi:hypothetical protein
MEERTVGLSLYQNSFYTTHPSLARLFPSLAVPNILEALIHRVVQLQARVPHGVKEILFFQKNRISHRLKTGSTKKLLANTLSIQNHPSRLISQPALSKTAALLSNSREREGNRERMVGFATTAKPTQTILRPLN